MTRRQQLMASVLYPESIHKADEGDLVREQDAMTLLWQIPCRGCGEHFTFSYADITDMKLEEIRDFTNHRLWCFRCKRRRESEAAAARGALH